MSRYLMMVLFILSPVVAAADPPKKVERDPVRFSSEKVVARAGLDGWIELGDPTPASHGREFIMIDDNVAPISRLRLDATAGRPKIISVLVHYRDGTKRNVKIDKVLTKPEMIDLRGARSIRTICVVSEGRAKAMYAVHGEPPKSVAGR